MKLDGSLRIERDMHLMGLYLLDQGVFHEQGSEYCDTEENG